MNKYQEMKNIVMAHGVNVDQIDNGMRELTAEELSNVFGGFRIGPFDLSFSLVIKL